MEWLLMTRASIDTHCKKQVLDFEMAFCQNEAQTTEAIREVKAHCGAAIREAQATCATAFREAETTCADHAYTIQQLHSNTMQCLEREAIEGGGGETTNPS